MRTTTAQDMYHDYADVIEEDLEEISKQSISSLSPKKIRRGPRGGVTTPFPVKLHQLLEANQYPDIISWQPHGRCFILRKPQEFLTEVMTKYFKQTKLTSFQRQLNLYAFRRISSGVDKGAYYHELFLRGKSTLCTHIFRMRVKGTKIKSASCPEREPNFYQMPALQGSSSTNDHNCISEDDTVSSQDNGHSRHESANNDVPSWTDSANSTNETVSSENCDSLESVIFSAPPPLSNHPGSPSHRNPGHGMGKNLFSIYNQRISTMNNKHKNVDNRAFAPPQSFVCATPYMDLNSSNQAQPVSFEGKEFYYLDSFDHWDACTLPSNEGQSSPDLIGLSLVNGELCGFER